MYQTVDDHLFVNGRCDYIAYTFVLSFKAYFSAGQACMELQRYISARDYFAKCISIDPANEAAKTNLETAEKAHIGFSFAISSAFHFYTQWFYLESHYPKMTKDLKITVQYIDPVRGKGVFAKVDLK